jgi:hypothetical protein
MTRLHNSLFTIKKIEPEIPVSYPKRRPLDAATMHVMMIESVNLPPMLMHGSINCHSPTSHFPNTLFLYN